MRMFMIEWWCEVQQKYMQEYYLQSKPAFNRFIMLEQMVKDSRPEISTLFLDDSTEE